MTDLIEKCRPYVGQVRGHPILSKSPAEILAFLRGERENPLIARDEEIFKLFFMDGVSFSAIGERFGLHPGYVRNLIHDERERRNMPTLDPSLSPKQELDRIHRAQEFKRLREMEASDYLRRMAKQQNIKPMEEQINTSVARLYGWVTALVLVALVLLCACGIYEAIIHRCEWGC